jgi:hypothetical protein
VSPSGKQVKSAHEGTGIEKKEVKEKWKALNSTSMWDSQIKKENITFP